MKTGIERKSKRKMGKTIIAFIVILILAVLIEMQIAWMLTRNSAEKSTTLLLNQIENVLSNNEEEENERTNELKENYISYAKSVAYILDINPEAMDDIAELKGIAELQQIDEIHIFDETGTIIGGTVPKYYGYSFDSGEQMGYFKPMLEDKSLTMCQDVTPNTAEGKNMMYAIVWNREGTRMIQVGIEPKRLLAELEKNDISNVVSNIPITEGFDIYVIDTSTGEIAATTNKNDISQVQYASYAEAIGSGEDHCGSGIINRNGIPYFCNYRPMNDYIVAVAYNMRYSASSMAASLIVVAVYVSMAGIGCLRLISKLYKAEEKQNTLNEELEKANRDQREQLQRITALNETLKEEEDIIQAAGHGIWKCPIDSDGRVCGMIGNKQWKTIFGTENMDMTPEEELLYFVGRLVNQSEDPRNFGFDDMKPDEIIHLTFAWNHPIKGVIYVEMASAMHTMSDGTLQVSGYAADVTEQTISEQKWEEELLRAREKAEASSEAKTQFLFNMSHDIRTPMNAIIGFTDLLEKHLDDREQAMNYISKIKYSNEFLLSLINNVLEMARIESGKETLDETRCNVYDFNDSLNAVFASQMKEKGLNFDMSAQVEHPDVLGDTTKVKEIFLNILSNALKYTPEGGSVTFRTTELPSDREGYALYQTVIADTGIGMSKEFLPHLFEEFSRERNTTESKIVGTGLGMPIVKNLVGLMNGTIEVESEPGRGTTFTITIPHRIVTDIAEEEEKSALTSAVDFRGKRILLAEDNDLNAEIAMEFLHEAGFAVERAADGIICVDMLQKAPEGYYDLILMDIQMPNMDGYKATRVIRDIKDSSRSNIPILAMTANAFEEDRRNALAAGMNGHLSKPIKLQTLMETLTEILK